MCRRRRAVRPERALAAKLPAGRRAPVETIPAAEPVAREPVAAAQIRVAAEARVAAAPRAPAGAGALAERTQLAMEAIADAEA